MEPYVGENSVPGESDSFLARALSGVGNVLSAPRRFLWDKLNWGEHGKDWFNWMPGGSEGVPAQVLGFGAEVLGDPLTWIGGALASKAGKALGKAGTSLGRARTPATSLAVDPLVIGHAERVPTIYGATLQEGLEKGVPGELVPGGLLGRKAGAFGYSGSGPEGTALAGDVYGGLQGGERVAKLDALKARLPDVPGGTKAFRENSGWYDPASNAIVMPEVKPLAETAGNLTSLSTLATRRHERMHALVEAARGDPELLAKLPFLARTAARLKNTGDKGFLRGFGEVADEMAGYGAQVRNPMGQLRRSLSVLFDPAQTAKYLPDVSHYSPLAGRVYGALPKAFVGTGALGAHGIGEGIAGLTR